LEYFVNGKWIKLLDGNQAEKIKIHRFARVWGEKIRLRMHRFKNPPALAEFGVYDEQRRD